MQRMRLGFHARPLPVLQFRPKSQPCRCSPVFRLPARPIRLRCIITARSGPNREKITKPSSAWRSFWATIDAGAWLGTVGSAVAFLLTQEALLVGGPILLPIIALYASKQRGRLDSQAAQAELQTQVAAALRQVAVLSEESAADVAEEVAALVDEVRQGKSSPEKAVRTVEAKLSSVEGIVRNIEEATKGALDDAAVQRSKAVKDISAALVSLRRDVNADLRQATGDELSALGKVDGRLAALEGAINGLEVAQSEGLRRLGSSMSGALLENKDLLAATIRDEVWESLEPVRQLPQALAEAAPGLTAAAEQSGQSVNEESLRALVAEEIAAAGQELLDKQRELLNEAMITPTTIAPAQWNQLGKKLVALDDQLTDLKTEQEDQIKDLTGDDSTAANQVALLRFELVDLSKSVKLALEQQQGAQEAALALATQPGAMAEELLLGPLEASLLQLQNELRSAAEVAAVDRQASDSKWLVDLEIRLVKLVNPVLEAIAAAREASLLESASSSDTAASSASTAAEASLDQAAAGITSMSVKLESLGNQLAGLEERLLSTSAAVESRQEQLQETTTASSSPSPSSLSSSFESNSSVLGVFEIDDEETTAKKEAYQRMQALLHGDDDNKISNNNTIEKNAAIESAPAAAEEEIEEEDEVNSMSSPLAATGVPISDWLSLENDEDTESIETGSKSFSSSAEERVIEKEEVTVVGVSGNSTTVSGNSYVDANRKASFVQEQIAFGAALAAGEDSVEEVEKEEEQEVIRQKEEEIRGGEEEDVSSNASSSNGVEAPPSSSSSQAQEGEDESREGEQQAPVDLQALYLRGLELLRQGRSYAAAADSSTSTASAATTAFSVVPGQQDALNAADAALTEASRCFQAASSISDDTLTRIKAIGNCGNALMAKARVKRQHARMYDQQQQSPRQQERENNTENGSGSGLVESLQSEATELLVLAGRRYREVLVNDPSQGRAFLNWGRAVCLRAEIAKESGDFSGAFSLYTNAAEKFQAALQLDAEPAEGLKLAGTALASAATCVGSSGGDGSDAGDEEEEEERTVLLEEAEGFLVAAIDAGAGEEAIVQLEECRRLLDSS